MFLKRRNLIAWILILLAAVLWTLGQAAIRNIVTGSVMTNATTSPVIGTIFSNSEPTIIPTTETVENWISQTIETQPTDFRNTGFTEESNYDPNADGTMPAGYTNDSPSERTWGFILCIGAIIAAVFAIFVLHQTTPLLGPDGAALLLVIVFLLRIQTGSLLEYILSYSINSFIVLAVCRELWGWLRSRMSLEWCLSARIAKSSPQPQFILLLQAGWVCVCAVTAVFAVCRYYYVIHPMVWILPTISGCLGILCLWKFGSDLEHYEEQLQNFQNGLPITIRDGAFHDAEALLQLIQRQHEEAVRTAVTSERFKVELISNVSHDLRTPLTSILGYSELLQKQALSPDGQEQLRRLHQKAGYMLDLVESLFELTKVSSGVIEAKKEEIDLVRLLEQTIGLFDDQLTGAGLLVRRNYASDTIPMITDGARMHQVFANLLGNAIKYALNGTRIYLEVKETQNSYLIRMVNTSSYEMDFRPEEIMQRFARGDKARSTKGSGLGLAIAQTYTESVGGTFRVSVDGDQFSAIVELPKN